MFKRTAPGIPLAPTGSLSVNSLLWRDIGAWPASLLAMVLATAFVLSLYPLSFLAGHGEFFERTDPAMHGSGWLFYAYDSWHFPLLKSLNINYPEGMSVVFTDSIPLMALILKPIIGLLPDGFNYLGIWQLLCYNLQALAAVFLIRSLGIRTLPGAILAAGFSILWPALMLRFGHTALMTQGLLLLSLGIYLRGSKNIWTLKQSATLFVLLNSISLLVHPYLLGMTYPLFAIFMLAQWKKGSLSVRAVLGWIVLSLGILLSLMLTVGYLAGDSYAAGGLGLYSTNILSPFCGGTFCPAPNANGGQYEGAVYLGAGTLMLLLISLVLEPKALYRCAQRHSYLFLLMLGFTIFALSNKVYFGNNLIFEYQIPDKLFPIFSIFRASGRFAWLPALCLLFFVLATLLRRRNTLLLVLMACALALQAYDTRLIRGYVHARVAVPSAINIEQWKEPLRQFSAFDLYPDFGCASTTTDDYVRYQYIAARLKLKINTGYTARANPNCTTMQDTFKQQHMEAGHLYVHAAFKNTPLDLPELFRTAILNHECITDDAHLLCAKDLNTEQWRTIGNLYSPENITATWPAERLERAASTLVNGWLVAQPANIAGYLNRGPFIRLNAGQYHYKVEYRSSETQSTSVGYWDWIGFDAANHVHRVLNTPLTGTDGESSVLEGDITIPSDLHYVELRFLGNGARLELKQFSLSTQLSTARPPLEHM